MKAKAIVAVSVAIGVLLALVMAVSVSSAGPPPDPPARPKPRIVLPKARITWSTPVISQTVTPGTIYTATVTFTSTQPLTNATIMIAPNVPLRVRTSPSSFASVPANVPQRIDVGIFVPPTIRQGRFNAMIYVRSGSVVFPQGLKVSINLPKRIPPPRR